MKFCQLPYGWNWRVLYQVNKSERERQTLCDSTNMLNLKIGTNKCICKAETDSWYRKQTAVAAAAKSLQSCLTLCDPIDGSPPGSPVPGILQARTLEWAAISFSSAWKWKVKVNLLSHVWLLATPWTAAHQAPPSMGFSRREYWSGVPLPSPKQSRRGVKYHKRQHFEGKKWLVKLTKHPLNDRFILRQKCFNNWQWLAQVIL